MHALYLFSLATLTTSGRGGEFEHEQCPRSGNGVHPSLIALSACQQTLWPSRVRPSSTARISCHTHRGVRPGQAFPLCTVLRRVKGLEPSEKFTPTLKGLLPPLAWTSDGGPSLGLAQAWLTVDEGLLHGIFVPPDLELSMHCTDLANSRRDAVIGASKQASKSQAHRQEGVRQGRSAC